MAAKDELIDLLQDRFAGHELDVPPGAWEAITAQLAHTAGAEGLRETLQDKFNGHEMDVDPGVWQNISSQLGHTAAAGAGASAGWLAAGAAAVVVTGGLLLWSLSDTDQKPSIAPAPAPVVEQVIAAPTSEQAQPEQTVVAAVPNTPSEVPAAPAERRNAPATAASARPSAATTTPTGEGEVDAKGLAMVEKILRDLEAMPPSTPSVSPTVSSGATRTPDPSGIVSTGSNDNKPVSNSTDPVGTSSLEQHTVFPEPYIFIPNVFTPNGDGVNETLEVTGREYKSVVEVRIFSARDNTLVFQAKDLDHQWDGRLPNGQPAESGMYFYALEVIGLNGRIYPKGQVVQLNPLR